MRRRECFICCKCGKPFYKWVGGIVTSEEEMIFRIHPICDECKVKKAFSIVKGIIDIFKK